MKKVDYCRVCESKNIIDLDVTRTFYLLNMDESVCISYAICQNCHFIFQKDYVGDEFLTKYYNRSLMYRRSETTDREQQGYKSQSDFINRYQALDDLKVLEIGADTGQFLMHLNEAYGCDVYFDELSETARRLLLERKVIKDFQDHKDQVEIDIVVLRHIFEHIFDLNGFLKYVSSVLKDGGQVFIEVPDWSFLDESTDPFIFEHLNQFNVNNLTYILRKNGFVAEQMEKFIWSEYRSTPNRVIRMMAKRTELAELNNNDIKEDFQRFYTASMSNYKMIDEWLEDVDNDTRIALYPASGFTFEALLNTNLKSKNIIGIYDVDEQKHGKKINDVSVFPREQLSEHNADIIFVLTMGGFELEIVEYLKSLQLSSRIISWSDLKRGRLDVAKT